MEDNIASEDQRTKNWITVTFTFKECEDQTEKQQKEATKCLQAHRNESFEGSIKKHKKQQCKVIETHFVLYERYFLNISNFKLALVHFAKMIYA